MEGRIKRSSTWFKRHPEIFMFGTIATIYTFCCAPDITWTNVNTDSFYFFTGAAYLTDWCAQPLYKLLGHLAMYFPFGTEGWRLAFFGAAIPAIITAVLVFYAIKKQTRNKYAPYVGSLAFAASSIVIAQATVQDLYSMAAMCIAGAYLAIVYDKHKIALVLMGCGFLTHWITVIPCIVIFLFWKRELLKQSYILVPFIIVLFALTHFFGSYQTIPYWLDLRRVFFTVHLSDIPQRILDTASITLMAGTLAWIPAWLHLKEWKRNWHFLAIIGIPIFYLLTCAATDGYVQMYVAIPFLAIAAGLGIEKLRTKHLEKVVLATLIVLLLIMPLSWDIGRTVDENPTTARQWLEQVKETPEGSIILCVRYLDGKSDTVGGMARSGVEIASNESGRAYHYLYPSYYMNKIDYYGERARLREQGFETPFVECGGVSYSENERANLMAFAEANGNIRAYYTVVVDPEVFKCELVELK